METHDFRKAFSDILSPKMMKVEFVDIPALNFLMVDGQGDPNTSRDYSDAVSNLYGVAYTIKFAYKKEKSVDFNLLALEGLWWVDNMNLFSAENKNEWKWTMMLFLPDFVSAADVHRAIADVKKKKEAAGIDLMRYERFTEGLAAQVLHVGPYLAEKPTIDLLHRVISEQGYKRQGKHHEIYLGDPRKASPEKLKTIIRQPVCR